MLMNKRESEKEEIGNLVQLIYRAPQLDVPQNRWFDNGKDSRNHYCNHLDL